MRRLTKPAPSTRRCRAHPPRVGKPGRHLLSTYGRKPASAAMSASNLLVGTEAAVCAGLGDAWASSNTEAVCNR